MRRNKTYEQQKKFYDKGNTYESLGDIFKYWLECGNESAESMQETYRECNRECKEYILQDLFYLCDLKTFNKFVRIFNFGKK